MKEKIKKLLYYLPLPILDEGIRFFGYYKNYLMNIQA